ncbi:MAG TPA: glycosyltransferase family 9 protein, partial [Acidobacteriaceae bacterium]|nr:glycosyltransferase family 9 protein [Acidobacteriaceae bacterium]
MPSLPKHSLWKFFSLHVLAGGERLFRSKPFRTTNDLRSIRNFLLLQYDTPLGSAVHATPVYEAIKHHIHGAHISVAASSLAASVLKNNPYVDDCMVTPDPWKDFVGAVRAVRHIYRNLPVGPVCIATTRGNQRSKAAFLAMLAGDAVRTGFTLATPMYDLPLTIHPERSQIEDNLDILRILGHNVSIPEPRLFFSNDDAEYAARWLSDAGLSTDNTRIIYVTKNSAAQRNQWRQERFEQVIRTLSKTLNAQPIFVGSAGEATDIDRLRHQLDQKGISLAGKTTIPQLAALMALCDIVVSLDTGTFHVARAVGLPGAV